MKKAIIIFFIILWSYALKVSASQPTLTFEANTPLYFVVTELNNNEISCKHLLDYEYGQEFEIINVVDQCYLSTTNDTIFIDGEGRKIVENTEAFINIKENTIISAFLMEDAHDVENQGMNGVANIIVYNLIPNLIVDNNIQPRYYPLINQFSFYNYNLNESRFFTNEINVYDKYNKIYNTKSIVLWQDEYPEENLGEYANNIHTNNDFVGIYWLDSNAQIEKAFLIEVEEKETLENNIVPEEKIVEKKENKKMMYFIIFCIVGIVFISTIVLIIIHVLKKKKEITVE